jgi:uncharacterized SAM-binding protein YcdF (DUF218 family)
MERVLGNVVDMWLMPLPLVVLLLGLGCALLWWRRSSAGGRLLASAAWLVLVAASCTALSDLALLPLEERYPKWSGANDELAFVVVLGASAQDETPRLPETNLLNPAGTYRLLEALAIYRANPGSKLILSGGNGRKEPFAAVAARVAQAIGVPAGDILLQPGGHNTEQEVALLAAMVGRQRFAVVTSAAHMPRTMQLFAAAGLQPLAAPAHYLDRHNPHPNWRDWSTPSVASLDRAEFALHEYLSLAWLWLKGLVS